MSAVETALSSRPKLMPETNLNRVTCKVHGCKRTYKDMEALNTHLQDHQISVESLPGKRFLCSIVGCEGSFSSMQDLMEHMRIHYKPNIYFICESCRAKLRSYRTLLKHIQTCAKVAKSKAVKSEAGGELGGEAGGEPGGDLDPPNLMPPDLEPQPPTLTPAAAAPGPGPDGAPGPDTAPALVPGPDVADTSEPEPMETEPSEPVPMATAASAPAASAAASVFASPSAVSGVPAASGPSGPEPPSLPFGPAGDPPVQNPNSQLPSQSPGVPQSPPSQPPHPSSSASPPNAATATATASNATWRKNQGQSFSSRILWEHSRGRYSCLQCGHAARDRQEMTNHIEEQHKSSRSRSPSDSDGPESSPAQLQPPSDCDASANTQP